MSAAGGLRYRPQERGFLGLNENEAGAPSAARAVIVPYPLEATVSYGGGTARGPEAIISASPELEFFDDELWREPFRDFGIATLETPALPTGLPQALDQLTNVVGALLDGGRFPLVLGGEHSLTPGAVRAVAARHPGLVVVQIDAHTDLRDSYLGNPNSHACAMRRVLDIAGLSVISLGARAISAEEIPFLEANRERVHVHLARTRSAWVLDDIMAPLKGRPVYVSFDIDGLDAGIMPATGTPEPGGLSFDEACAVLRAVSRAGQIVGADIVELAPIDGLHACDFTAAKLVYKLLAYALGPRG